MLAEQVEAAETGRVQYEWLPVPDAAFAELHGALVRSYFVDVRRLPHPTDDAQRMRLLVDLGFATRHAGRVVPTVAGLLHFGARPQDRLPAATLKCAFFYGLHQSAQLRNRADAVGPLTRVIDEGAVCVARNRRLVSRMEGVRRVDVPEYPAYSVREAIANAVAHRVRSLEGAKVRLFMFDDRLEIWSPGKLPPSTSTAAQQPSVCMPLLDGRRDTGATLDQADVRVPHRSVSDLRVGAIPERRLIKPTSAGTALLR